MASELDLALILCSLFAGGEVEVRHDYSVSGETRYIRVDCETPTHVIEIGLDARRSSFDSVHQAMFAAQVTGKAPMVVIVDTNGTEEPAEYQVETVARALGVAYRSYDIDYLLRWRMTAHFRAVRAANQALAPDPVLN